MKFINLATCTLLFLCSSLVYAQNVDQLPITEEQTPSYRDRNGNLQVPKPPKDNPQARLEFELLKVRNPRTGEIPEGIRTRELAFMLSQNAKNIGNQLLATPIVDWSNRGPFNVGGRTRALAVDVLNSNTILAGGVSGGMWRSTNKGASWSKTTGSNELQSVTCVAQDPRSGFENTWYYGTGENRGNSAASVGASYLGNGVYKSTDNGVSWSLLASTASNTPQSFENRFDIIHEIVVDPTNGDVYVATYDAVYRSTDGGNSFTSVLGGSNISTWVDVAVTSGGRIFAALDTEGVFSSDDGTNWTDITPGGFPLARNRRKEIAIAPSNENIVYVIGEDLTHASEHTLWRFDDSIDGWVDRSASIPLLGGQTGNFDSQGSYNLLIKVKNDDPDFVIIGGTNLFRSTDGFSTTSNTTWIGGYTAENTSFALYPDHHPDQHSFVFLDGNEALSGNDGGVQLTTDITTSLSANEAVDWLPLNNGYLTTQVYAVSAGPGNQILAGFQDNGTWFTSSTNGTQAWSTPFGGDGAYSAFSSDGTTRYLSSQNGNIYRFEYSSADDETLDNFAFFTPDGYSAGLFIVPFYLDPTSNDIFYLAGANDLYVNTSASTGDNLTGWKTIALGGSGVVSEIGTSNDGFVVAGTFSGELFKVTDPAGSHVVTDITGSNFPSGFISGIDVNQFNGNEMIVSFSNYSIPSVFHTVDGGVTWTDISGTLEENPDGSGAGPSARTVRILGNSKTYFVGTSTGLYSTDVLDGSSTVWTQENSTGIGDVVVEHLIAKQDGTVIAGTHGNGVFSAQFNLGPDIIDLEISDILSPRSTTLGAEEEVQVSIVNQGNVSVNQFDLILKIDGEEMANVTVFTDIQPGAFQNFTFDNTFDLSAKNSYEFDIELVLDTDQVPENNRIVQTISSTPFVGTYSMQQVELTTSGTSATYGGGTLFSGSGVITVDVEYVDEDTRSFKAQYLSQLGFSIDETYTFDLINGEVIFNDNQETNTTCSSVEVILGTADTPGVYNVNDDSSFTLRLKENTTLACSEPAVDVEFTFSRLDGVELSISDRTALIAVYNATDGPNWTTTWDISKSMLEWEGVIVSSAGRVIDLTLPRNNLTGAMPPELGDLSELVNLVLTGNNLEGSIPSELGNLSKLEGLVIDDMQLSGNIPSVLWDLTNLKRLNLDFNSLEGQIPAAIGNLVNLERLDLDGNQFSGELPAEISMLTKLFIADLDFNAFTGSIPSEFGDMTSLSSLDLSNNQFSGAVPASFSGLTNIDFIDLFDNSLDQLPDLSSITPTTFNVAENDFDFGDIIPNVTSLTTYAPQKGFPEEILKPSISEVITMEVNTTDDGNNSYEWLFNEGSFSTGSNQIMVTYTGSSEAGIYECIVANPGAPDLTLIKKYTVVDNAITSHPDYAALEALYLSTNGNNWTDNSNWLIGSNLDDWFGITTDVGGRVSAISLTSNNLRGPIPSEIGDLSNLTSLELVVNNDGGELPTEISSLSSLTTLDLIGDFSGTIPTEIGNMTSLELLRISAIGITGNIPSSFQNLTNLTGLYLLDNSLSGSIADVFGNMTNLVQLDLQNNNFTGSLPGSVVLLGNLSSVIVSRNQLNDLPNLTSSPASFLVSENKLNFGDIVPNVSVLSLYNPQEDIDNSYFETVNEGGSTTIEVSDNTVGNTYIWFLNGEVISGAASSSLTISNFSTEDVGVYYCTITNPAAVDLTLIRNSVTLDINQTPTDITLSNNSIEENSGGGASVGVLSTTDIDSDSHTYSIESSDEFSIGGAAQNELIADVDFNFESATSASVEVTVEDDQGAQFVKEFTVNILDANDPPTDITLSNNQINEGESSGTSIGVLSVVDEDASDTHNFTLGGTDSGSFSVGGNNQNELLSGEVFNASTKSSYSIEVTATDGNNAQFTKQFTITIENALGLDDGNNLVQVYPNPSDGNFHVVLDNSLENPSWVLTDIGGKEIELNKDFELKNRTIVFDIGNFGSGVYLLKIQSQNTQIIKRIIIE